MNKFFKYLLLFILTLFSFILGFLLYWGLQIIITFPVTFLILILSFFKKVSLRLGCFLTGLLLELDILWYYDYFCLFKGVLGFIMVGFCIYPQIMKIKSINYKINSIYFHGVLIGLIIHTQYSILFLSQFLKIS